jgi:hypothetical protein
LLHTVEVHIEEINEAGIGEVLTIFIKEYFRYNRYLSLSLFHFGEPDVYIIPGGFGGDQRLVEGIHYYLLELLARNLA